MKGAQRVLWRRGYSASVGSKPLRVFARGMGDAGGVSLEARVAELEAENKRLRDRLGFEQTGRTNAERNLREAIVEKSGGASTIKPVGTISSCFPTRFGTPRQGSLAGLTKATIKLDKTVVAGSAFQGLEDFSHVWLIFVFHENTNMHKLVTNKQAPNSKKLFPSFVRPPQGGGLRVGLFATRTPHRPNPIGLSLARVDSIDANKGLVHLRGIDLIDGTPILDIKPYIPHVDTPVEEDGEVRLSPWVVNPKFDLVRVEFAPEVRESIVELCRDKGSKWYSDPEELLRVLEQVVALDPRGVIHGRGQFAAQGEKLSSVQANAGEDTPAPKQHLVRDNFVLDFDTFRIRFSPHTEERAILVHTFEPPASRKA